MGKEVGFSMNFESNLKELVKGLEEAKSKIESLRKTSSSTGGASYPKQWRKGLLPGGMSPEELYMGGQAGSVASGIAKAPRETGGGMSALGLGAVAGAAAGGVMALTKVMSQMVKQSQIISKFLGTLSKLFGMLIDLVLLPFIPLLVTVILGLTKTILAVGKIWNGWMKKSVAGEAIAKVVNPPEGSTALSRTIDFVSMINELVRVWFDGMKQLIFGIALAIGEIGVGVIKFVVELLVNIAGAFRDGWLQFQKIVVDAVKKVWDGFNTYFIVPVTKAINNIWSLLKDGFDKAISSISTAWNNFTKIWTFDNLIAGFKGFINAIIGFINGALGRMRTIPLLGGFVPKDIPFLAEGGTIAQTGMAVVHKGETVVPAGQSGGLTFNIKCNDVQAMETVIKNIMRKEGTRYMS